MDYQKLMELLMSMMGGPGGGRFGGSSTGGRFGMSGRTIKQARPAASLGLARSSGLQPNRFEADREGFGDNLLAALAEMNARFDMEQGRTQDLISGLNFSGFDFGSEAPLSRAPGDGRQVSRPRRPGGRSGPAVSQAVDYTAARRKAPGLFDDEDFGGRR